MYMENTLSPFHGLPVSTVQVYFTARLVIITSKYHVAKVCG